MTPAELLVLFSSYVIGTLLVWFANIADRVGETESEAAGKKEDHSMPPVHGMEWNVATFFGLRRSHAYKPMGSLIKGGHEG